MKKIYFICLFFVVTSFLNAENKYSNLNQFSFIDSANIQVIAPNGGETWNPNSLQQIQWISSEVENVKIEYTSSGDTSWNVIISNISAEVGYYYWTTPDIHSNFCRIKISDASDSTVFDMSDNFFTIGRPTTETEPNNTQEDANPIEIGDSLYAEINPNTDVDYFKFYAYQNDTLIISVKDINNSQLYGILQLSDEYNNTYIYEYFSEYGSLNYVLNLYNSCNYYIRISSAGYQKNDNKTKKDSLKFHFNNDRHIFNKLISDTGEYQFSLRRVAPSSPTIDYIYFGDTYFNSTILQVEFNPNGAYTKVKLEYGFTSDYGNTILFPDSISGYYINYLLTKITNLKENSVYHCRAVAENSFGISYSDDYLFTTPKAPQNWIIKSIDSLYNWPWFNTVSFANENVGFTFDGNKYDILKTTDGGNTWSGYQTNYYISRLICLDSLNVFALYYYGIYKTTNGGLNWGIFEITSSDYLNDFYFTDKSTGYAISYNNVYKTTDGGSTWNVKQFGSSYFTKVYFCDENNGWVTTSSGYMYKTTDAGETWHYSVTPITYITDIYFSDIMNGFILDGYSYGIYKTTDGGTNWSYTNLDIYPTSISFIGKNNGVIVGGFYQNNIFLTTDGGESWIPQESGTKNYLSNVCKAGRQWVAIGDFGTILKSDYKLVSTKEEMQIPLTYQLFQNYPNPFNPSTTIEFQIPKSEKVLLKIYDVLGNEIETIEHNFLNAGKYKYVWNAAKYSSGIYFCKLYTGEFTSIKKLILIK